MASSLNSLLYFLRIVVMTSSSFDYMVPLTGCPFFLGKFKKPCQGGLFYSLRQMKNNRNLWALLINKRH
jgi:hypothetical protein